MNPIPRVSGSAMARRFGPPGETHIMFNLERLLLPCIVNQYAMSTIMLQVHEGTF